MPKYYSRKSNGTFVILKRIGDEKLYFGSYSTEEEAQERVEFLKRENWDVKYAPKNKKRDYIYFNGSSYYVKKNNKYYGSYNTRGEAKEAVGFFEAHNWDRKYVEYKKYGTHSINRYITRNKCGNYFIQKYIDGKTQSFGTYKSLEEAKQERDLCIKCNWDWDLIVEQE